VELERLAQRLGTVVRADNTVITTHFGCGARLVATGLKHVHKISCNDCGVIAQSVFEGELRAWEAKPKLDTPPAPESAANGGAVAANGRSGTDDRVPEAEPEPEPSVAGNHTSTRPKRPPEPWWQHIPEDLTVMRQWVLWAYSQNGKKWTKVPQQPDGSPASSTDPATWASFEDVQTAYRASGDKFDGVGFVVTESDPFVGFDFDHVCDRRGTLDPTIRGFIDELASYTEVSPSGHGVRVFVRGKLPEKDRKLGDFECYESGRYLTLTGDRLLDSPTSIRECQEAIESVHAAIFAERTAKRVAKPKNTGTALVSDSDAEQLERARKSKGGEKFIALYDRGDWKGAEYPSQSEADQALCGMLRFWLGADAARIDAAFRRSGLYREKWDREDYRERTIGEALPGDVYGTHFHADRELFQKSGDGSLGNGHVHVAANATEIPELAPIPQCTWPEMDSAALFGLAGEFVNIVEPHTEADPVALLIQFLAAFGNAANRNLYAVADGAKHYLTINTLLIGDSSKARKGTSWTRVRRLFELVDPEWAKKRILGGLSSGEGLISAVRDPVFKREKRQDGYEEIEVDAGVPDKRLLVQEPEFASVLKVQRREGNTLSMIIRQAFDTGDLGTMVKNNPTKATGAQISIVAHITIEELLRHFDRTELANGYANRFLFFVVRRSKSLPFGGELTDSDLQPLANKLLLALEFARRGGETKFSVAAREVWRNVYPELSAGRPGLLGAVLARGEAQTLRLACLFAALDQSVLIEPKHLFAALAVWEYSEASAEFVFSDRMGDPDADTILTELRHSPAGLTRTEISNLFGRNRETAQIERALTALTRANLVERSTRQTAGRTAECWIARTTKETKVTKKGWSADAGGGLNSSNSFNSSED
jgi:hypothetical protein